MPFWHALGAYGMLCGLNRGGSFEQFGVEVSELLCPVLRVWMQEINGVANPSDAQYLGDLIHKLRCHALAHALGQVGIPLL